jgi:DNA-binding transcriptional MerR regulator
MSSFPLPAADALMLSREVAALFGVGIAAVSRWERAGLIVSVRTPGGGKRYRVSEVNRLLREHGGGAPA